MKSFWWFSDLLIIRLENNNTFLGLERLREKNSSKRRVFSSESVGWPTPTEDGVCRAVALKRSADCSSADCAAASAKSAHGLL